RASFPKTVCSYDRYIKPPSPHRHSNKQAQHLPLRLSTSNHLRTTNTHKPLHPTKTPQQSQWV
ncbi:hypothetical protein K458DRAFT_435805, partial [Lentithecium fluviatile CBS 122367]